LDEASDSATDSANSPDLFELGVVPNNQY
jgi:hypothetical protein